MSARLSAAILVMTLVLGLGSASAATLNQSFMNDFESNAVYLWSLDSANMRFDGFSLGSNMEAWQAEVSTPEQLVLKGPTIAAGAGRFNLLMNYQSTPFRLEWAEVFFDKVSNVVRGYGTLTFDGNGWSNSNVASHVIDIPLHPTAAALPIPASYWLLASALALMSLRKRVMV